MISRGTQHFSGLPPNYLVMTPHCPAVAQQTGLGVIEESLSSQGPPAQVLTPESSLFFLAHQEAPLTSLKDLKQLSLLSTSGAVKEMEKLMSTVSILKRG